MKVTVTVTKGKKKLKGKVKFSVNGTAAATSKLRKGKASYRLSNAATPGLYKVTAKYKGKKKSTKIRVYSSALSVSATSFTISASADSFDLPMLTGSVQFKDAPATKGYVDIYQNGNVKGGSGSPDYCCMTPIEAGGVFDFSGYSFLAKVQAKGPWHVLLPGVLHRRRGVRRLHLLDPHHGDRPPPDGFRLTTTPRPSHSDGASSRFWPDRAG